MNFKINDPRHCEVRSYKKELKKYRITTRELKTFSVTAPELESTVFIHKNRKISNIYFEQYKGGTGSNSMFVKRATQKIVTHNPQLHS